MRVLDAVVQREAPHYLTNAARMLRRSTRCIHNTVHCALIPKACQTRSPAPGAAACPPQAYHHHCTDLLHTMAVHAAPALDLRQRQEVRS